MNDIEKLEELLKDYEEEKARIGEEFNGDDTFYRGTIFGIKVSILRLKRGDD